MNLDLSILVVTYRNAGMVAEFHELLCRSLAGHGNWQLLYRDHSPDSAVVDALRGSPSPPDHLSRDASNPGFAAGVNFLLSLADRAHILLLNPDVSGFSSDFWPALLARHAASQALFIRLCDPSGQPQDCVGRRLSFRRALTRRPHYGSMTEPVPVDNGIMAFMLSDRSTFERVGALDEDYPLYAEDMDWCYRARQKGVSLIYDPRLTLTHAGGASAGTTMSARQQRLAKYRSERIFIHKHFRGIYRWAMLLANYLKAVRAVR